MRPHWSVRLKYHVFIFPLVALGGCAGSASDAAPSSGGGWTTGSGGATSGTGPGFGTGGASAGSGGSAVDPLPPEQEVDSSFEVPVATGRFVWVANPLSGRVAFIDALTLKVKTVEAGNAPTYLSAVPGQADAVVVLNVLSHDASVLRADAATDQLSSVMVPGIAPLANAWAVAPDGRFALAWTDARRALAAAPNTRTLEGFQDVTAIDLNAKPPTTTTVAVGYRPVSVTFSDDSRRAFAVTQDGVSVLGLPGATGGGTVQVLREVPLTGDPSESADTRDVSITADGRAVVRREGSSQIRIVDLSTGATGVVSLSGPVTDLDVTADGARAIAVVRQTSEVALLPLATAGTDAATVLRTNVTGELIGSVTLTADSKQALLYSNATDSEHLVVLDLATATYHVVRVHAPVLSVFPTPDGQYAVVLHHQRAVMGTAADGGASDGAGAAATPGTGTGTGTGAAAAPPPIASAFSLIPLDGSRSGRIQETVASPQAVAIAPNSSQAIVTVADSRAQVFGAYLAGLPGLQVTRLDLASPPIATGVVAAANRGYVAQRHPEGRITFVPFTTGVPQTLTGFDLGARVVTGAN
ncbi:MAG: hypothetical protein ABIS92_00580 [Polyangia bacterium]